MSAEQQRRSCPTHGYEWTSDNGAYCKCGEMLVLDDVTADSESRRAEHRAPNGARALAKIPATEIAPQSAATRLIAEIVYAHPYEPSWRLCACGCEGSRQDHSRHVAEAIVNVLGIEQVEYYQDIVNYPEALYGIRSLVPIPSPGETTP